MTALSHPARVVVLASAALLCASGAFARQRVVDLTPSDGLTLKASFFPAAAPGPGVLLLHQCNRQRKVWDGLAQQLAAAGLHVLTFDYRGYGESGGDRFGNAAASRGGANPEGKMAR